MMFSNLELEKIVTPIDVRKLEELLKWSGYNPGKTKFLIDGFRNGFDIGYRGPEDRNDTSQNIPFHDGVGNETEMWNKIMKEIQLGRYSGPFDSIPTKNFIQSPIGLVPKGKDKTRLIFHLSFNFGPESHQQSVNSHTPVEITKVKYEDLDVAIHHCLLAKNKLKLNSQQKVFCAKMDLVSAFRILPARVDQRRWMTFKARNLVTKEWKFFTDNCVAFGGSRSCTLFQDFSDCLKHITEFMYGTKHTVTNYLDDFLFTEITEESCNKLVRTFLKICKMIHCPVSMEKSEFATTKIVFLGILLDLERWVLALPEDKTNKALFMLNRAIEKKKLTVKAIQSLTGTLNFLNKAIIPGRTFTRRMYSQIDYMSLNKNRGKLRSHHHVNLSAEFVSDCKMWVNFLTFNDAKINRPMIDWCDDSDNAEVLEFYSDASKGEKLGFGCFFNGKWAVSAWETNYIKQCDPSIAYLELYALCVGVALWCEQLANRRVVIFCDNKSTRDIVNKGSTGCRNMMFLMRNLVLSNLKFNTKIFVRYIKSEDNILTDRLSRLNFSEFWKHAPPHTSQYPETLPKNFWPASKIWIK